MPNVPDRLSGMRCADQDREIVAQLLNNAYADGRLTIDEHTDRIAAAYDAKTFGDLNRLTTDLVAQPAPPRSTHLSRSALKPGAIGTIAERVTLNAWLGEIHLDLVGVAFQSRHTTIHVGGLMCDVKIRVPQGVTVNTGGLTSMLGDTKITGTVPHPQGVVINLVGTVIMGEVKVMGPDSNPRKYEKFVRR